MALSPWQQRFFASTRGRIVALLRRTSRTVDELAQALDLTDNAVRAHLAALERDGLVHQQGARKSSGKPASIYALNAEADALFPKAYAPVLDALLDVLDEQLMPQELETLMRTVGHRIAALWEDSGDAASERRVRIEKAIAVLNSLGGMTELVEQDGMYRVQGYSCPLAAIVSDHPAVCRLTETLVAALVGAPVQEQCHRDGTARCRFLVPVS